MPSLIDRSSTEDRPPVKPGSQVAALVAIAVVLALLVLTFLKMRVCDEQLTNAGVSVDVCRHVHLSDPPVAALGIVLVGLVTIAFPFVEISGFGFSLRQRVTKVEESVQEAKDHAEGAKLSADNASTISKLADEVSKAAKESAESAIQASIDAQKASANAKRSLLDLEEQVAAYERLQKLPSSDVEGRLTLLAREYNETRAAYPSSNDARTAKLTQTVASMVAVVSSAGAQSLDGAASLNSSDMGVRVEAYAYYYVVPDGAAVPLIVNAIIDVEEPKGHRFGQYWGLRAIRRQVQIAPGSLDENSRRRLKSFLKSIPSGSDRASEIREILSISPGKHGAQPQTLGAD